MEMLGRYNPESTIGAKRVQAQASQNFQHWSSKGQEEESDVSVRPCLLQYGMDHPEIIEQLVWKSQT
jgi:hypothetical protein